MKHEPRPAIHMEKQLCRAHKLGGMDSLGISSAGKNSVSHVDGVSYVAPACQLCGSDWMDVISLILLLPDFHSAQFLTVLSVGSIF